MKYNETAIIYNKIKEKSGLTDSALELIGITKEKIDTAMQQCTKAGMSNKQAMKTIYKMWNYSEPEDDKNTQTE